ncbi:DUF2846 domain-containing protein [Acinetobacter sp. ANC 4910]|uniref:DUF2846 domain-containing protein n=1 Tax=Acinetobacter sp. ANC 4910 TaxID=2529850 RepID=UPI00103BD514|nr:DUF2846 domain-containing protein [Acinetobacter sp. ANC 4910]TCB35690.1 DUF2846 domain-containing protein [Acinetobacter sp. ANC 4910]
MRSFYLILCSSFFLFGCHKQVVLEQPELSSTLHPVDTSQAPGMVEQYRLGMTSVGGWVNQKLGQRYHPVQAQHDQAAVVYLYRPDSRWNRQEIVASSLFINKQRIPSLLNNHYYWLELPAGTYRLSSSRPLGIQHFQKPKYLDFTVEAGKSYYVKYDEENLNTRKEVSGPLILVPNSIGQNEIAFTQLKSASYNFVAQNQQTGELRHKAQKIKAAKYDAQSDVQLTQPFKIWDIRTW